MCKQDLTKNSRFTCKLVRWACPLMGSCCTWCCSRWSRSCCHLEETPTVHLEGAALVKVETSRRQRRLDRKEDILFRFLVCSLLSFCFGFDFVWLASRTVLHLYPFSVYIFPIWDLPGPRIPQLHIFLDAAWRSYKRPNMALSLQSVFSRPGEGVIFYSGFLEPS